MRRLRTFSVVFLLLAFILSGCNPTAEETTKKPIKIGIMLTDNGLGDQSFNDTAFAGLMKARDELGILFDYRDLSSSKTYEQGLTELVQEHCDLVIGLGFTMVEDFTKVAKKFPQQKFMFIDDTIDAPNVTSVTFREEEGSFIVGAIAGLRTQSNTVGFIGGMDAPVIQKFRDGYIAGVRAVKPNATVLVEYAGDFGKPDIGKQIARRMIQEGHADVIYPAAGFTGVGALEEASAEQKYAIGVDSDQFYLAEKSVITSMLKNVDVAIYSSVKTFAEKGSLPSQHIQMGLQENGVGTAPVRIAPLNSSESAKIETLKQQLLQGAIKIPHQGGAN